MSFQQQPADTVQRRLDGRKLIEYIITVGITFNHAFNTANLAFNPVKPCAQYVLKVG
ncbi:hypothetical protein D3C76_1812820 [compost metagenome]